MTINPASASVETGDLATYVCPCCGQESETVQGYLFDETGATAVYFARYTRKHAEQHANMVLSIGGWGEGMTADDRHAIAIRILSDNQGLSFEFPSPETSPWSEETFLGCALVAGRLSDEERQHYRELATIVAAKDSRLASFLYRGKSLV